MAEASKPRRPRQSRAGARPTTEPGPAAPSDAANLDEAFVKAIEADFIQNGHTAIEAMRTVRPTEYVKLVAAMVPKFANDAGDPVREISDAELDRQIEEFAAERGYELRRRDAPEREETAADEGEDAD